MQGLVPSTVYSFKPPVMKYNPLMPTNEFSPSWDRFFTNKHDWNCPISKCTLMNLKAGTVDTYYPLTEDQAKVITVGPAPDFKLTQSVTVKKGYDYNVHLMCQNGF